MRGSGGCGHTFAAVGGLYFALKAWGLGGAGFHFSWRCLVGRDVTGPVFVEFPLGEIGELIQ